MASLQQYYGRSLYRLIHLREKKRPHRAAATITLITKVPKGLIPRIYYFTTKITPCTN